MPDALLTPEGCVAAFSDVVDELRPGARVLDCAAGIGQLAVGLALRGFDVAASDANGAMIERIRTLAARHGAALEATTCEWENLTRQGWGEAFDAVFCVGNSLTHATGQAGRRAALAAMGGVLCEGGLVVVTSRNWERLRDERPGLLVADRLAERDGSEGLVVHAWTIPDAWEETHLFEIAVAVIDEAGGVTTRSERLPFWPFTHRTLEGDLRAAGLAPVTSTYAEDVERYVVTARRGRYTGAG
ncbi:MAG TPA: class I SAM-dependent methyltransferase [Solirubrobacteraceae bacterium]|nr:class I SAM-dependent methyltransferase [Solirubrobacteraceae bacterium]